MRAETPAVGLNVNVYNVNIDGRRRVKLLYIQRSDWYGYCT